MSGPLGADLRIGMPASWLAMPRRVLVGRVVRYAEAGILRHDEIGNFRDTVVMRPAGERDGVPVAFVERMIAFYGRTPTEKPSRRAAERAALGATS